MGTNNQLFQRGAGVFDCAICHRRTRGTRDSAPNELCGQCDEISAWDNHFNDHGTTPGTDPSAPGMAHFDELLRTIGERGGDVELVKDTNGYIWITPDAMNDVDDGSEDQVVARPPTSSEALDEEIGTLLVAFTAAEVIESVARLMRGRAAA